MAYGSNMTAANLAAVINEVWSPEIQRETVPLLLAADFFKNVSNLFVGGGKVAHVPGIYGSAAQLEVKEKVGGSEYELQSATMDEDTITIETWKAINFIIEDLEAQLMLQTADVPGEFSDQAAKKIAKDLDSAIFTALTAGVTNSVGSTSGDLTDGIVREAIEIVSSKDVPVDELAFFFNTTTYWHDLMGADKYVQAFVAGWPAGQTPVITGNFGNVAGKIKGVLYGIPVYVSTQVPKTSSITNFLAHPSAAMYAVRTPGGNMVRSDAWEEKLKGGTVWRNDIMYGVDGLRGDLACKIVSNVGGIVS